MDFSILALLFSSASQPVLHHSTQTIVFEWFTGVNGQRVLKVEGNCSGGLWLPWTHWATLGTEGINILGTSVTKSWLTGHSLGSSALTHSLCCSQGDNLFSMEIWFLSLLLKTQWFSIIFMVNSKSYPAWSNSALPALFFIFIHSLISVHSPAARPHWLPFSSQTYHVSFDLCTCCSIACNCSFPHSNLSTYSYSSFRSSSKVISLIIPGVSSIRHSTFPSDPLLHW